MDDRIVPTVSSDFHRSMFGSIIKILNLLTIPHSRHDRARCDAVARAWLQDDAYGIDITNAVKRNKIDALQYDGEEGLAAENSDNFRLPLCWDISISIIEGREKPVFEPCPIREIVKIIAYFERFA